jgi:hypothetical protein
VLSRGIVFIDLAIAQVAGLGVIAAHSFGLGAGGWSTRVDAGAGALGGALLLTWTERKPAALFTLCGSAAAATPQVVLCLTYSQTLEITTEPSPTAEATRFTDPARTSPTAKMPG